MITAKQVRAMSKTPYKQDHMTLINEIESKIVCAAKQGYCSITWEKSMPASVREHFRMQGFKIKSDFLRNEVTHNISWKEGRWSE